MGEINFKQKRSRANKHFKYENSPDRGQGEPDVFAMIKKIQQQLVFLERKIDLLIGKSSSKPFRADGHSGRYGSGVRDDNRGVRDDNHGKRSFHKRENPFSPKRRPRP